MVEEIGTRDVIAAMPDHLFLLMGQSKSTMVHLNPMGEQIQPSKDRVNHIHGSIRLT